MSKLRGWQGANTMTRGSDDGRYFKMHIKYVRVHSTILNNICDFRPWPDTRPAHQPGESRLRLVTVVVSVHGALGSEAQTLTRQVSGCERFSTVDGRVGGLFCTEAHFRG